MRRWWILFKLKRLQTADIACILLKNGTLHRLLVQDKLVFIDYEDSVCLQGKALDGEHKGKYIYTLIHFNEIDKVYKQCTMMDILKEIL